MLVLVSCTSCGLVIVSFGLVARDRLAAPPLVYGFGLGFLAR